MKDTKNLELYMDIDNKLLSELHPKITQKNIILTVQDIKKQLLENNVDKDKVFNIYDVSIEILQNILKYSYGNIADENNKRQADGDFRVSFYSTTSEIMITSSNLITAAQAEVIKERIEEVKGLNEKELRKLIRLKMKTKKDGHENGAGLGFATIASKISKPLSVEFETILDDVIKYKLKIFI